MAIKTVTKLGTVFFSQVKA